MRDLDAGLREAVRHFWQTRTNNQLGKAIRGIEIVALEARSPAESKWMDSYASCGIF